MKTIEVRDQVSLPLRRCFQLTVRGIRHRLFRSLVTVVIVTLAVAFLMMMLATSFIDRQVAGDVRRRTADRRLLEEWVGRLTVPLADAPLAARLSAVAPGSPGWRELLGWGRLTDEELRRLVDVNRQRQRYDRYLTGLKPADRSALAGAREGQAVYEYLTDPEHLAGFVQKAKSFGRLPTDEATLRRFVEEFNQTAPLRKRILDGHAASAAGLKGELGTAGVLELLTGGSEKTLAVLARHGFLADPEVLATLREQAVLALDAEKITDLLDNRRMRGVLARRVGVDVPDLVEAHVFRVADSVKGAAWLKAEVEDVRRRTLGEMDKLRQELIEPLALSAERIAEVASARLASSRPASSAADEGAGQADATRILALLEVERLVRVVAARAQVDVGRVKAEPDLIFKVAATLDGARWLKEEVQITRDETLRKLRDLESALIEPLALEPGRIAQVASGQLGQGRLAEIEASLPAADTEGWLGFSGRTGWLIIISFLVCVVGVANAMLMSVTERFREIATMKCLGALDSFIMILFVMESSLQGLVGGLVGVVLGLLLGLMRSAWGFGLLALGNMPPLELLASAGLCLVAGMVLAALAAVYPAWVAARLAPMEAMRIE